MSPENFVRNIVPFLARQPFTAFTVELKGGKRFEIDHAHAAAVSLETGRAVFLAPGGVTVLSTMTA